MLSASRPGLTHASRLRHFPATAHASGRHHATRDRHRGFPGIPAAGRRRPDRGVRDGRAFPAGQLRDQGARPWRRQRAQFRGRMPGGRAAGAGALRHGDRLGRQPGAGRGEPARHHGLAGRRRVAAHGGRLLRRILPGGGRLARRSARHHALGRGRTLPGALPESAPGCRPDVRAGRRAVDFGGHLRGDRPGAGAGRGRPRPRHRATRGAAVGGASATAWWAVAVFRPGGTRWPHRALRRADRLDARAPRRTDDGGAAGRARRDEPAQFRPRVRGGDRRDAGQGRGRPAPGVRAHRGGDQPSRPGPHRRVDGFRRRQPHAPRLRPRVRHVAAVPASWRGCLIAAGSAAWVTRVAAHARRPSRLGRFCPDIVLAGERRSADKRAPGASRPACRENSPTLHVRMRMRLIRYVSAWLLLCAGVAQASTPATVPAAPATRLDHILLWGRGIDQTTSVMAVKLGFQVRPGRDPGGVANLYIRFADSSFIELLGITRPDPAFDPGMQEDQQALKGGPGSRTFGFRTSSLDAIHQSLQALHYAVTPFFSGPDSAKPGWRLFAFDRAPLSSNTFFIDYAAGYAPDQFDPANAGDYRVTREHPNGARELSSIWLVSADADADRRQLEKMGYGHAVPVRLPVLAAKGYCVPVGPTALLALQPDGAG